MESNKPRDLSPRRRRVAFPVWLAVVFFATLGVSLRSVMTGVVLLGFAVAAFVIENRTQRPRRSFYRLGLASTLLFAFLVIDVATWNGDWFLGALTWLGMSCLGMIWTAHYERTEPRT